MEDNLLKNKLEKYKKAAGVREESPTYTTILHRVRKELGLSMNEYCVADYVHKKGSGEYSRENAGWVISSKETIAKALKLSRITIIRAINDLEKKKILERHPSTKHLRTTYTWHHLVDMEQEKLRK
jgi:DNA-binding MarR family transcriptional regulator